MKISNLILSLLTIMMISCKEAPEKNPADKIINETEQNRQISGEMLNDGHNSQNSLDWAGTYEGTLPCADCPGIATKIVLNQDDTYDLEMEYLERDAKVAQAGTISWGEDGNHILLKPDNEEEDSMLFRVGENLLFQLDKDGKVIDGELAKKYILKKKNVE